MIRLAALADAPAFHAVMMAAGMDPRSSWSRTTVEDVAGSLNLGGGFLAWAGGNGAAERAVGCVSFQARRPETLTLNKLATSPDVRGQGIGAALVRAVEQVAAEGGYGRVLLAVSQYNLDVLPFISGWDTRLTKPAEYAFTKSRRVRVPVVLVKAVWTLSQRR